MSSPHREHPKTNVPSGSKAPPSSPGIDGQKVADIHLEKLCKRGSTVGTFNTAEIIAKFSQKNPKHATKQ
jgi:hypothetical protein